MRIVKKYYVRIPAPLPVPGQVLDKFKGLLEQTDSTENLLAAAQAAGFEVKREPRLVVISWHNYVLAFEVIEFTEINSQLTCKNITFYSV